MNLRILDKILTLTSVHLGGKSNMDDGIVLVSVQDKAKMQPDEEGEA